MLNLDQFWRDDKDGEFEVTIVIRADVTETVKASSESEARRIVEQRIANNEIDVFGEDIETADIRSCRRPRTMYLVERPGTTVSATSRPEPGDLPREPKPGETAWKPAAQSAGAEG